MSVVAPIRTVLSVEDVRDSTESLIGALRDEGVVVIEAGTIGEAAQHVSAAPFDFILLDARVPDTSSFDVSAGPNFIREVKRGLWGHHNVETPFLVLTSYVHEIEIASVSDLIGFRAVVSKSAMTTEEMSVIMGLELTLSNIEDPGEYVVDDLVIVESPPRGGRVFTVVPSWAEGEGVWLDLDDVPDDVRVSLGWGEFPVYIWARVNIAALNPEEVRPRELRLSAGTEKDAMDFDTGSTVQATSREDNR